MPVPSPSFVIKVLIFPTTKDASLVYFCLETLPLRLVSPYSQSEHVFHGSPSFCELMWAKAGFLEQ